MSATTITDIRALEIIDDRGRPTIRAWVEVESGHCGRADVPCGSSTGSYEAFDLRDGDERYGGWGVRRAIGSIRDVLRPALLGGDAAAQRAVDEAMIDLDGTPDKSNLGGNAILGVSLACAKAAAAALGLPLYRHLSSDGHVLPVPQAGLINGGLHAGNDPRVQEFCVIPVGSSSVAEAVRLLAEVFATLRTLLRREHGPGATNFSEDGGFAPPLGSSREAMELLCAAVDQAGYADDVVYGLDVAVTGLWDEASGTYRYDGREPTRDEMIATLVDLVAEFPAIVSVEDPLHQDDLDGWRTVVEALPGDRICDGFISVKRGQLEPFVERLGGLSRIRVMESGHPVPDQSSYAAGCEVLALADAAGAHDLVILLMSGGVSAQVIAPVDGVSIEDKATVNRLLVTSGAEVTEIMTVRRQLSRIKGGRLAGRLRPATVLALTVSDEKTDTMEWNTDWTSPDSTTAADAVAVLHRYELWERLPTAARAALERAAAAATRVTVDDEKVRNHMIVRTRTLAAAAVRRAADLGLTPLLLTTLLGGESRDVGRALVSLARRLW